MRKAMGIAVLAALILSFSGCANTENPHTTESSSQKTVSAEIIQSTEPEESSAASVSGSKESSGKSTPSAKAETAQTEALPTVTAESSEVENPTPMRAQNRKHRQFISQLHNRSLRHHLRKKRQRVNHRRKARRRLRKNPKALHFRFRLGLILRSGMPKAWG